MEKAKELVHNIKEKLSSSDQPSNQSSSQPTTETSKQTNTMSGDLPKTYKRAVFKEKGADLVFEQVDLELPKDGQVRYS